MKNRCVIQPTDALSGMNDFETKLSQARAALQQMGNRSREPITFEGARAFVAGNKGTEAAQCGVNWVESNTRPGVYVETGTETIMVTVRSASGRLATCYIGVESTARLLDDLLLAAAQLVSGSK